MYHPELHEQVASDEVPAQTPLMQSQAEAVVMLFVSRQRPVPVTPSSQVVQLEEQAEQAVPK